MTDAPSLTLLELADTGLPSLESYSPFCVKAHRALKLAGLPYRRHCGSPLTHRRASPTGQVPVLRVGDETVPDSTDILMRIQQLVPDAFAPHPEAWLWEELADTAVNGFVVAARWADERNWPVARETLFGAIPALVRGPVTSRIRAGVVRNLVARGVWRAGAAECWRRFEQLLDHLEGRAPERGFWLTERPSVADLALFAQLHSLRTPLTVPQAEALARRVRLTAWLDRVDGATRGAPSPV